MSSRKKIGIVFYNQSINIGDDVQTLAMMELVQRVARDIEVVLVDREHLNEDSVSLLDGLIVSGWFMDHPSNWPPNNKNILYVSFHVNSQNGTSDILQSKHAANDYLHATPIGCRDIGTLRRFKSIGLEAYFSGCATLTIEPTARKLHEGKILAIDPFYKVENDSEYQNWQLKNLLSPEDFGRCTLTSNDSKQLSSLSSEARLKNTKAYLQQIQDSDYILTSRIHAALPAVALGTPVFFIDAGYDRNEKHRDRFEGLINLFNVIDSSHFPLSSRKRWAKACRKLGLHKVLGNADKIKTMTDAIQNQQPIPIESALAIKARIEEKVQEFVERIVCD